MRNREPLSKSEWRRYARHLTLPHVGEEGQQKLKDARVLLVGAGGLGSPAAMYLAAAGVGKIGLADFDVVDESNLHRQILHGTGDIGRRKVQSGADRMRDINPFVRVEQHDIRLSSSNALDVFAPYDIVLDGTDNFATRYLTNDACVLLGKPNVYGSIFRFEGQASVFAMPDGPCYRCLVPEPPPPGSVPSCAEAGVFGVLPGLIGTIQATEAIKLILGVGDSLSGRLLLIDTLAMDFRMLRLRRDPDCPACGTRTIRELIDYDAFCGYRDDTSQTDITPAALAEELGNGSVQLIDVREPGEWARERIDAALLVPLGALAQRVHDLDPARNTVVMCQSGIRSARAAEFLREHGFSRVRNLAGGIARWSREGHPTLP